MAARTPIEAVPALRTRDEILKANLALATAPQGPGNGSPIPKDELALEDLHEWWIAQRRLAEVKEDENRLRKKLFKHFFPMPREGTNIVEMPDGTRIKASHKIDRKPDVAQIEALKKFTVGEMRTWLTSLGIDVSAHADEVPTVVALGIRLDNLFEYKPDLVTSEYRTLTAEQRAVFEMSLVIKDGSPQVELIPPKAT